MQHDPKVTTFYLSPSQPFLPNMSCCRSAIVDEHVRPACDDLDTDNYNDEDENNEDHDDTYVKYNDIQQSPIDEYDIDMTDVLDSAQYKCASTAIHEQTNATVRELVEDTGNTTAYLNQQLYRTSSLYDVSQGIHAELTMFYKQIN